MNLSLSLICRGQERLALHTRMWYDKMLEKGNFTKAPEQATPVADKVMDKPHARLDEDFIVDDGGIRLNQLEDGKSAL